MQIPKFLQELKQKGYHRQPRFWLKVAIILFILLILKHCSSYFSRSHTPPGQPIVSAVAKKRDVPIYLSGLGAVTPTYSVTVHTQVSGQLWHVYFQEGQLVKAGDLLAEIDPRPYEAQLTQYEGQLARDKALLANATLDLHRYQTLWKQNSVSKQVLDTQASLVQQDAGNVKLDEGLIESTKVNLIYCHITSPINGRIGLRLIDPGNLVQPSDTTGLAIINMLNPITVVFSLPEDDIPELLAQMQSGKALTIEAFDRQQTKLLATGKLITIDNQVDPTTGMVKLKAQFTNNDNRLFPSQFVNARLLLKTLSQATVIPTAAIQYGQSGNPFVYLVNQNNTVTTQSIHVGATIENDTVSEGVTPGQAVVIEGADKLVDGSPIMIAESKPQLASPATASLHRHRKHFVL
jgi:multidrug efflux system membrane fusion protein